MQRASDLPLYIKALVYGHSGSGKTTLACTGHDDPAMSTTLVINIEGGMLSAISTSVLVTDRFDSLAQVQKLFYDLASKKGEYGKVRTLVIDSGTELMNMILFEVVANRVEKSGKGTIDDVELQDYGKATNIGKRLFRMFRDLEMNVICTALVRERHPPATKLNPTPEATEGRPGFTDVLGTSVMGFFDHVWYLWRNDKGEHQMLTQPAGIFRAKTRGHRFSEKLGNVVSNPNLVAIHKLLMETETNQKAKT